MSTRRLYFQNTKPGHNKDYEILADYDTLTLTSAWGKIGHPKAQERVVARHAAHLDALLRAKITKRESRGYELVSDDTFAVPATSGMVTAPAAATGKLVHATSIVRQADTWTLNRDVWEMERAERLAKKLP